MQRAAAGEAFQVLYDEPDSAGWRFACLAVAPGPLRRLHYHPDSEEIFVAMEPRAYLAVATAEDPTDVHVFWLTVPVCVRRGVWHEAVAEAPTHIYITENRIISGHDRHFPAGIDW